MARLLPRTTLVCALGLVAVMLSSSSTGGGVAAYARRSRGDDDYLAELTEEDLRLSLQERGVDAPSDASRRDLVQLVRQLDQEESKRGEVEAAAISAGSGLAPVKVSVRYCVGWGYRNAYGDLADALRRSFGDAVVTDGDNYPPSAMNQLLSTVASNVAWGGFIATVAFPNSLPAQVQTMMRDSKMMVYGGLFMLHSISNALVQTGAFEVEVDGQMVFSKLDSGQAPNLPALVDAVADHVRRRADKQE